MKTDTPLIELSGVGKELVKKLCILNLATVNDLINYYPRRYDDYSNVQEINRIRPGIVTVKAQIKQARGHYVRRGMHITEAVASDASGSVRLVWFNQPYRAAALKTDDEYFISGDFGLHSQRLTIQNPSVELVNDFPINTARIIPVYRETKGLKSTQLRKLVREINPLIGSLAETLPPWLVKKQKLMSRAEALHAIHFPNSQTELEAALRRLGFEEVFSLTLAALLTKCENEQQNALVIPFDRQLAQTFVSHLSFKLTDDQRRAIWQIYLDIQKSQPMNRLLEGDVGSGKTVVAVMVAVMAIKKGFQVAFMAPTDLLARQHADTIRKLLIPLGLAPRLGLLVGSLSPADKRTMHQNIKDGGVVLIVGTHALIQEKVAMHKLGLVIIDEQHRFGVEQRKKLQAKAGHMPHVLSMTATPIPRSLALSVYGEMDLTTIVEKPGGRQPPQTTLISPNSRSQMYQKINQELETGRQVFVVCPLISDSDLLPAKSAEQVYEEFSQKTFKNRRVGLLHGKLKSVDKEYIMQQFMHHQLDILVATTVIEVGVDIPNASVMLIESAERFGLAQMHQLRGRVGRGQHQGYCFLALTSSTAPSPRLRALLHSSDGFALAELDLEIRGPGAIYGTVQHGELDLRVAKLSDTKLIANARQEAQKFLDKNENLLHYKELSERVRRVRAVTNLN